MTQTLSVTLPAGTLYVSGTVNGAACTWTLAGDDIWQAVAPRSPDDVYHVALTMVNGLGTASTASFTLYYGVLALITDRTQGDVDRAVYLTGLWVDGEWTGTAEELAEWDAGLRGAYNAADLNRVEAAVDYIAGRLNGAGYDIALTVKQDWTEDGVPTAAQMARYLANVAALRAALAVPPSTPAVPADMAALTFQEANDIEQILLDINTLINNMAAAWVYSGEIFSGEVF